MAHRQKRKRSRIDTLIDAHVGIARAFGGRDSEQDPQGCPTEIRLRLGQVDPPL